MTPILYFVIPCYNDESVLPVTGPLFLQKLLSLIQNGEIEDDSRVVFVNDGSADATWMQIERLHNVDPHCIGLDLACNVGEQNALLTGMFFTKGRADCCITMDSDMQDDITAVDRMLQAFKAGNEIVFGVRSARKNDAFLERVTSKLFYRVMRLAEKRSIPNHSNYRLMSRGAIDQLKAYRGTAFYLPVLTAILDLPSAIVYYERLPRAAGTSGYNFRKRLKLGTEAIASHVALRQGHPRKCETFGGSVQRGLE